MKCGLDQVKYYVQSFSFKSEVKRNVKSRYTNYAKQPA